MNRLPYHVLPLIVLCVFGLTATHAAPPKAIGVKIDFHKHIQPILKNHCSRCHSGHSRKGGLSIETKQLLIKGGEGGPAVVVGKSDQSEMILRAISDDKTERMPSKGKPLSAEQIKLLRAWIDQGMTWPEGYRFTDWKIAPLAPRQVKLPPANGSAHPIDRLVEAYWRRNKIKADAVVVDDRTFARRVWLDLVGLLPPTDELDAFVKSTATDKRAKLVDRLLADNDAYAKHWLTFWSDMLRNAYRGTGYIDGGRKQITQWLYAALYNNMPYDQFTRELISPVKGSEGFISGIKWRGNITPAQARTVQASRSVGQVFLGTNLKCASCHDSFVNQWTISEVWSLASVFADKPLEIHRCGKPTGKIAAPAFLYPELGQIDPKASKQQRMAQLAKIVTGPRNGRLTRTMVNRFWALLLGRGIVEPVDDMDQSPWDADLLDWLASDLATHRYDLKRTLKLICTSRAYQLASVGLPEEQPETFVFGGPIVRRMSAEQFFDALSVITRTQPGKLAAKLKPVRKNDPHAKTASRTFTRASLINDDPLSRAMGRTNREQIETQRDSLATTLQALEMTNGVTLDNRLRSGAKHWVRRAGGAGGNSGDLLRQLYIEALGRRPSADEMRIGKALVGEKVTEQSVADLLWIVTMLPEFQLIQ